MKTKKYKFNLKDGSSKTFDMTQEERDQFYSKDGVSWLCSFCNSCKFNSYNCAILRGFSNVDINSIEEVKAPIFKLGDTVSWCGVEGVVTKVKSVIAVNFGNGKYYEFFLNGEYLSWHKEPSLILVKKAEKKTVREIEVTDSEWVKVLEVLK